ncbi:MAG: hypothetical protein ACM3XM_12705 [Mycobacterium leprae]
MDQSLTPQSGEGFYLQLEQPVGCTGELCKEDGTYASLDGGQQYFAANQPFGRCPNCGRETRWIKMT